MDSQTLPLAVNVPLTNLAAIVLAAQRTAVNVVNIFCRM